MKRLVATVVCMVMLCFLPTACSRPDDNLNSEYYDIDLKTMTLDSYSLDDVKEMGYVVMESVKLTSGAKAWDDFVTLTRRGLPAKVRVVNYYPALDKDHVSEEFYEQNKDHYPVMYVKEVVYDGEKYSVTHYEGDTCYSASFDFLIKSVEPGDEHSTYETRTIWFLCNDENLTYGDITNYMHDSGYKELLEFERVCSDIIYKK